MTMYQSLILWSGPGGAGGVTVVNHGAVSSSTPGRFSNFFASCANLMSDQWDMALDPEYRILDEVTGQLTGYGTYSSPPSGAGNLSEEPLPDGVAALVRLQTAGIVNGRRIRGHAYIPGLAVTMSDDGNVATAAAADLAAAADTLWGGPLAGVVWHRPVNGSGGSTHSVDSASVWTEWSSQRRRRRA